MAPERLAPACARPWGQYRVLAEPSGSQIKEILVRPGQRLSLQRHRYRGEHWYVVHGRAVAVCDDHEVTLEEGRSLEVPRGVWHRIMNPGDSGLLFIEVQTGEYFGEDDIERLADDYGRI